MDEAVDVVESRTPKVNERLYLCASHRLWLIRAMCLLPSSEGELIPSLKGKTRPHELVE